MVPISEKEPKTIQVLVVEDNDDDRFLIEHQLQDPTGEATSTHFELIFADSLNAAKKEMQDKKIDVILLDLGLPDANGINSVAQVTRYNRHTPVVVVTGANEPHLAMEALQEGVQDYLPKSDLTREKLIRIINYAIERHRIKEHLHQTNWELKKLCLLDPLTGLLNRRGLQEILLHQRSLYRRNGSAAVGVLIDLDNFKYINDHFGHAVGDQVLRAVAQTIKSSLRESDYVARLGGDEFVLMLPETHEAGAVQTAEKIRVAIAQNKIEITKDQSIHVTASLGLIPLDHTILGIDNLLSNAHQALRASKMSGKNRLTLSANEFASVENLIGFSGPQVKIRHVFQPIMDLLLNEITGFEVLSRFNVPDFEEPNDFFRLCKEKGQLEQSDFTCFQSSLKASSALNGIYEIYLNLFPGTLDHIPVKILLEEFRRSGRPLTAYCLEISEQQILGDPACLAEPVSMLRQAGIQIAVDNVGFGRSSLEGMVLLEPDWIKIDRRILMGNPDDEADARFLQRLQHVAKSLGADTIAEGIETEEGLALVKRLGIRYGQGFHFGRLLTQTELSNYR